MAILFRGSAFSFRTLGSAATPQNLLTIENPTGTARVVNIIDLVIQMDATAVLTSVTPQIRVSRITTLPTGGTALPKIAWDPAISSSHASIVVRGATASDGGAATAITATAGDTVWQQYLMRIHTLVGQILFIDSRLLPPSCNITNPFKLAANSALLVQLVATAGTSNPNTNHYIVGIAWEEDG